MAGAGSYEVGTILARLGLDAGQFDKGLNAAVGKLQEFATKANTALAKIQPALVNATAGIQPAIAKAITPMEQAFKNTWGFSLGENIKKQLSNVRINDLTSSLFADVGKSGAKAIQTSMAGALAGAEKRLYPVSSALNTIWENTKKVKEGFVTGFNTASTVVSKTGQVLGTIFKPLTSLYYTLRNNPVLPLIGAYMGGAAIKGLIEMANKTEKLTFGFENLSQKIGAISTTFLPRLRAATKGTISDMDLMQNANAAILLGAAQTEDQFVQLAEGARRLGQAMGINVNYALQSLSYGIGRQSRLWLDNLGIIVQAGNAQERYAAELGKTKDQLTDTEKRQAFTIAAMEAMKTAVDELGPDIELTANAWERMSATITNTWAAIGKSITGSSFPNAVTKFLLDSKNKILAWSNFIVNTIKNLFEVFKNFSISDILTFAIQYSFKGAMRTIWTLISEIGPAILEILYDVISNILRNITAFLVKEIVTIAASLSPGLFKTFIGNLEEAKAKIDKVFSGRSAIEDFGDKAARAIEAQSDRLNNVEMAYGPGGVPYKKYNGPKSPYTEAYAEMQKQIKEATQAVANDPKSIDAIERVRTLINQIWQTDPKARDAWIKSFEDALGGGRVDLVGRRAAAGIMELGAKLGGDFVDELKRVVKERGDDPSIIDDLFNKAAIQRKFEELDPIAGLSKLILNKYIQPISDGLEKIARFRESLITGKGEWTTKLLGSPPVIIATGKAIEYARHALESFGKIFSEYFQKFFGQKKSFLDTLTATSEAMGELQRKASLTNTPIGLEEYAELIKKLRELDDAVVTTENHYNVWWMRLLRSVPGVDSAAKAMINFMKAASEAKKKEAWEAFSTLTLDDFNREIKKANREMAVTNEIMKEIDSNRFVDEETIRYMAEMNAKIEDFAEETGASADEVARLRDQLEAVGRIRSLQKLKDEVKDFRQTIADEKWSLDDLNPMRNYEDETATAIRKRIDQYKESNKEIQRQIEETKQLQIDINENPDLYDFERNNLLVENEAYIQNREQLKADQEKQINDLVSTYDKALDVSFRKRNQELTKEIATSIGEGLVDGFLRGEKASKIWTNIATDIFRKQMSRAINDISNLLASALDSALGKIGVGSGIASVALGAVALGVSILGAIKNRKDTQVEDFEEAITSSEAMRGVVAGPTNVAIAKMGDSLKFALATTEVLLSRIATGIDKIAGTGEYASGPGVKNMAVRLSPSSAS